MPASSDAGNVDFAATPTLNRKDWRTARYGNAEPNNQLAVLHRISSSYRTKYY